jgi:hypothetical protein
MYFEDFEKPAKEGTLNIELESKHIFAGLSFLVTPTFLLFPLLENQREESKNGNSMVVQCSTGFFQWAVNLE